MSIETKSVVLTSSGHAYVRTGPKSQWEVRQVVSSEYFLLTSHEARNCCCFRLAELLCDYLHPVSITKIWTGAQKCRKISGRGRVNSNPLDPLAATKDAIFC